jgi:ADP-ribosyl-[dinitrogen reductase] hydrolase
MSPGTFEPISELVGGGPFGLEHGQWTDDTSMALCLAESLIRIRGHDPQDQLRTYLRWYREAHLSSTGKCFDIGNTVRSALERFERTGDPYPGPTDTRSAGNGSLMRLAPVPMFFSAMPRDALEKAAGRRSGSGSWARTHTSLIAGSTREARHAGRAVALIVMSSRMGDAA